ncbi:MAG: hypothetical protein QXS40_01855, partial [Candidatus Nitrosocaldus sp.]
DGKLDDALLQHPLGLSSRGKMVYVADTYNHAIRLLDLSKGEVSTLVGGAGDLRLECRLDDSCRLMLYEPSDVKVKGDLLYIADTNNHLLRVLDIKDKVLYPLDIVD